ncbi:putative cadmium/zinc-transporting ATPase HMA1, chloroplastic, partial [Dichanthelium oligosanthes]
MPFLTAPALVSSGVATPVPLSASHLRLPPFPRRCARSPPKLFALTARPPLLNPPHAHGCHHHHHGHCHGHNKVDADGEGRGAAVMRVARAIGWAAVADALRERLQACCISLGLFLMAAACPHVAPLGSVRFLQVALIAVACPLVGVINAIPTPAHLLLLTIIYCQPKITVTEKTPESKSKAKWKVYWAVEVSAALDALVNIADGRINIHVLMALAAFASIFMGNALEGGLLLAMFNLAHIAEEYFTSKSMFDVRELKENHPEFALLLETSGEQSVQFSNLSYTKVPVHDLEVGSHILVRAGEAVPVDGEVYQGSSTVTIEHLTGETKPLERTVGDAIPGGARNLEGMMIVKVTKSWEDSTLNRIVQLTEEGQLNKPKLQRWLDEFGEYYSRVVVALSLAVALLGPLLFKWPFFGNSGLMVAASPCALAVAPLAYATAISSLASKGILLKGGHVLDALSACQSIAFDKTGTLTTGKLTCKAIEPIHGHLGVTNGHSDPSCCTPNCESEALAVAAAMEKGTTHPIGRAVLDHSVGKELPAVAVESFECLPGRGVAATLSGVKVCVTLFHFEDEPRSGVCEVIYTLREKAKLRIMMLTGDHESSAQRVAKAVCIDEVHFSLKPEDKLNKVKAVSREGGGGLIMVGDGINDAPALAAATVGMVLAQRASATAVAVADVLLLQDNICGVPFCIAKARQTTSLVKQSVALALTCIVFATLPSVLGFLPLWLT